MTLIHFQQLRGNQASTMSILPLPSEHPVARQGTQNSPTEDESMCEKDQHSRQIDELCVLTANGGGAICRYIEKKIGSAGDARGLTYEVRADAHAGLPKLRKKDSLKAFVFKIADRKAGAWKRANNSRGRLVFVSKYPHEPQAPDEEANLRVEALRECLTKLKVIDRQLLYLLFEQSYSPMTIARIRGVNVEGIYKRLQRLGKRLKSCIMNKIRTGQI